MVLVSLLLLDPEVLLVFHLLAEGKNHLINSFSHEKVSENPNHVFELRRKADLNAMVLDTEGSELLYQTADEAVVHLESVMVFDTLSQKTCLIVWTPRCSRGLFLSF